MVRKALELNREVLAHLDLPRALFFEPETPLETVIAGMQARGRGSALVIESGRLVGIVTERDILARLLLKKTDFKKPVQSMMTQNPISLNLTDSLDKAVDLMVKKGIRHVPILDRGGHPSRVISIRDVIDYLAERHPMEVFNLPPDPNAFPHKVDGG